MIYLRQKQLHWLAPIIIMFIFIGSGFISIDFGAHPDENKLLRSVQYSFVSGVFLPGWYNYPSLSYNIAVLGALLQADWLSNTTDLNAHLANTTTTVAYHLNIRRIFLLITSFTILWVYGIIYTWRKDWREALIGAALFAFSWEVSYHARWIAPDTMMLQFGALAIFCLFMARTADRARSWGNGAAICVALACATKYSGWALLVPLFSSIALRNSDRIAQRWRRAATAGLLFAITFFVVSPGNLLDLYRSITDIRAEGLHYTTGHNVYTIQAGAAHMAQIGVYFIQVAFSPYSAISIIFALYAAIGLIALIRERSREMIVFLSFPCVYLSFISAYQVMFVRNLLICLPFLMILAARGVLVLAGQARTPVLQLALRITPGLLIAANAAWVLTAAHTIAYHRDSALPAYAVVSYLEAHPQQQFWATAAARGRIAQAVPQTPGNLTADPQHADAVIFLAADVDRFPANDPTYLSAWFGTREVNYSYYPSSIGDRGRRFGVLQAAKAEQICVAPFPHNLQAFCDRRPPRASGRR